jgi:hypothetical protein
MRINNPQSMLGMTSVDNWAYDLASIGQVNVIVKELRDYVDNTLKGNASTIASKGYAWLNEDGKVDTSLLPQLAISNTTTVSQNALKNTDLSEIKTVEEVLFSISNYLKNEMAKNENKVSFQAGDVVVVTVEAGEVPNPLLAGAYIITKEPTNESEQFELSRLSYNDGKIVQINGKQADPTGNLYLELKDILSYRFSDGPANPEEAESLAKTVYRLNTIQDEDGKCRFGFKDLEGNVEAYTKLSEFEAEKTAVSEKIEGISGAIIKFQENYENDKSEFNAKYTAEVGSGWENEASAADGSLMARSKYLMERVEEEAGFINNIVKSANSSLKDVHASIKNVHQAVNKRAVRLYLESFTWTADECIKVSAETQPAWKAHSGVKGMIKCTHLHTPLTNGSINQTGVSEMEGGTNVNLYNQGLGNTSDAHERVLAVYDKNWNLVTPDMKLREVLTSDGKKIHKTEITVHLDYFKEVEGNPVGSLAGEEWHMLIAKTIDSIDINDDYIPVATK